MPLHLLITRLGLGATVATVAAATGLLSFIVSGPAAAPRVMAPAPPTAVASASASPAATAGGPHLSLRMKYRSTRGAWFQGHHPLASEP